MTTSSNLRVDVQKRVARITIDRPPLNVLDIATMRELDATLARVLPQCEFLVFSGSGPKGFSAGAEVRDHAPERIGEMLGAFHAIFRRLARAECVTIAAVHGYCFGGGMDLATFCDFVMAAESAKFAQPEIKLGCFPPVALVTLPCLMGMQAAAHLILTAHQISAAEAHRLGLVSRVVPDNELPAALGALLDELRALSPSALRLTRKALARLHSPDFLAQLEEAERLYLSELMQTHDAQEGVRAFLAKRKPVWKAK